MQPTFTPTAVMSASALEQLHDVATTLAEDIEGAAHVSVSVVLNGRPWASVLTHPDAAQLTAVEHSVGGPALDALWSGRITRITNIAHDQRWPDYSSACRRLGICSVAAFPIAIDGERVAVLTIASRDYFGIGRVETEVGREAAALASSILRAELAH